MTITPEVHPPRQHHSERWVAVTEVVRELHTVRRRRRAAKLHLFTYLVGNALFWLLWGAISVSTGHWYLWPVIPIAGWTLVLVAHLAHAFRRPGSHAKARPIA